MQYALANELSVAVDQSVYNDPLASIRLEIQDESVMLKGTEKPVPVYALSHTVVNSAFRLLETVHANVHNDTVKQIQECISGQSRSAVVGTSICTHFVLENLKLCN